MELEVIISKLDRLKGQLDQLRPLPEDRLNRLTQKLKLDWNYHSNGIEGNTLSHSETKSFILWGITAKGKPFRDYLEMRGHHAALNKLYELVNRELTFTEGLIRELHELILVEPYTDAHTEVNPGHWKVLPNYLYSPTGERIDFAPPAAVPKLMNELINWVNNHLVPPKRKKRKYDLHPLLIAAGFHSQFISIHPFGDSNGRMARILTNLILMSCGYAPAIVKLDDRVDYYTAINTSRLDDPEQLAIFLGKAAIESLELAIKAAMGEPIEEDGDIDKELQLLEQKLQSKKIELELKSLDGLQRIAEHSCFPFFEQLVMGLSKFDNLFEDATKLVYLDAAAIEQPIEQRKMEILDRLSKKQIDRLALSYVFNDLKNTVEQVRERVNLRFDFRNSDYTISDNLTNTEVRFTYGNMISQEEMAEWIKKIQRAFLTRLKRYIED